MLVFTKMEIMMKPKTCISCKRPFEEHTKKGSKICIQKIFKKFEEDFPSENYLSNNCYFCGNSMDQHTQEDSIKCIEIYVKNSQTHLS